MRIGTPRKLLMISAAASMLQACLWSGSETPEQPLPLLTASADRRGADANAGLSPEEARAQAVADIRARAKAYERQQDEAPYPEVFRAYGPPLALTAQPKSQRQIEAELTRVRSQIEAARDPTEAAALEQRMTELLELGRTHAEQSEQRIQANSERTR
jgi:hypothetical protein